MTRRTEIVAERKNPLTGDKVTLYDGALAGLDADYGKWSMVCEAHGHVIQHPNQREAIRLLATPHDWCEECMKLAEAHPEKVREPKARKPQFSRMRLDTKVKRFREALAAMTPEQREETAREMAALVRTNPGKRDFFIAVFGEEPETYEETKG